MKKNILKITAVAGVFLFLGSMAQAETMTREQIIAEADKTALAQFEAMKWDFRHRDWVAGAFWAGVVDLSKVSHEPKLRESINKFGKSLGVQNIGACTLSYVNKEKEPNHADDMCAAQTFLEYYVVSKDPKGLEDTKRRVGEATEYILSAEAAEKAKHAGELGYNEALTWYWIDALFMAAPVHARLSEITGDPKYLNAMLLEWKRVSDLLYDPDEHLYFRDKNFLTRKSKNREKIFWSRGNGWVMGAFAHTLPYIPKNNPRRPWLVAQFKDMATKLASIQRPNGTWSPSLMDYEQFPYSEMSGTALNCFGIAWGINNGILDPRTFRPVVDKAWAALLAARSENGLLGYVQGVGAEPGRVSADSGAWYGNGAFIMAATQMAQLAPIHLPPTPTLTAAPPK